MTQKGGKRGGEGGDIRVIMAELHCCTAETNTTLQSNHPPIRKTEEQWRGGVPSMLSSGGANKSKKNPARLS